MDEASGPAGVDIAEAEGDADTEAEAEGGRALLLGTPAGSGI